jgi:hypothetical protein
VSEKITFGALFLELEFPVLVSPQLVHFKTLCPLLRLAFTLNNASLFIFSISSGLFLSSEPGLGDDGFYLKSSFKPSDQLQTSTFGFLTLICSTTLSISLLQVRGNIRNDFTPKS